MKKFLNNSGLKICIFSFFLAICFAICNEPKESKNDYIKFQNQKFDRDSVQYFEINKAIAIKLNENKYKVFFMSDIIANDCFMSAKTYERLKKRMTVHSISDNSFIIETEVNVENAIDAMINSLDKIESPLYFSGRYFSDTIPILFDSYTILVTKSRESMYLTDRTTFADYSVYFLNKDIAKNLFYDFAEDTKLKNKIFISSQIGNQVDFDTKLQITEAAKILIEYAKHDR